MALRQGHVVTITTHGGISFCDCTNEPCKNSVIWRGRLVEPEGPWVWGGDDS